MRYFILLSALFISIACKKALVVNYDIKSPPPFMCAPSWTDAEWYTSNQPAPLFEGMNVINYPITTNNPEAQKYFNQGLGLAYGFNHAEAARSFHYATQLDSSCAMCYWGFAYVLGPNYNMGMEPDNYERAYTAIQKARTLMRNATEKEKNLINAMALRYVKDPVDDRRALDSAYMTEMKSLHQKYPEDVEIAAMYAESLMDMHPWDLWHTDGTAKPWTPEILKAIEVAINTDPKHPGGHHFYIHAVEASSDPGRALASCKVFDDGLVPKSGHLVHMPSHIYINTGDYHLGTVANIKAAALDSQYVTQCHAQGAYPIAYYPHNNHFLAACATLEGDSYWAIEGAKRIRQQTNHKGMLEASLSTLQHYWSVPYFVNVKFARWHEILSEGPPDTVLLYPTGIYHYAKGMAYAGLNQLDNAQKELEALQMIAQEDTLKNMLIWGFNSMSQIADIAQKVLSGEIAAKRGNTDDAVRLLTEAIAIEDQLLYQEPPDWFFSVRHHLGSVLLDAKRYDDAIRVYEEDLRTFPKNGWALNGLAAAYKAKGQKEQLDDVTARFKSAWEHADVQLENGRVVAEVN